MTDVLAGRFAALADAQDDSDWLDVRRRARRRSRFVLPAALVAAAVVAAAAVAASGGWIFRTQSRHVTASTRVIVGGTTYRVSITTEAVRKLCFSIAPPHKPLTWDSYCTGVGGGTLVVKQVGGPDAIIVAPGPPFRAIRLRVPGGEVVAGASIGFARRIALTDASGHVYSTPTIAAPNGTKTPFRFWAIGLKGTTARVIVAYDARGLAITRTITIP